MTKNNKDRRVVVTGLGVVSSLGIGWQEFWKNLLAGKSGISRIESFDTSKYDRHYAGEIKNFDPTRFMTKRQSKRMGRASQLAFAAMKLALEDAGLAPQEVPANTAVCIGTTMGEPQVMEYNNLKYIPQNTYDIDFLTAFVYPSNSLSNNITRYLKLTGPSYTFSTACAAGNYSIARSMDLIKSGKADCAIAGGADAFSRIAYTGFSRMFAIAPEKCQPFDKNRKGMIPGEGGGILILETLESARRRGAKIYAECIGYGMSCDAKHMTNPDPNSVAKAITKSLGDAKIAAEEVGYISAHGTGTKENDKAETEAVKMVFGQEAYMIPISSIKSMLGHTMGAASTLEAITCCLALNTGSIPPTINLEESDKNCDLDYVAHSSRRQVINDVLNNSQAFGGNNSAVIFKSVI